MKINVKLSDDNKVITSVFADPQEQSVEINLDDSRYADFYNSQPDLIQQLLTVPANIYG